MFSNVGWGEILLLLIVGLVLIGPERLPHIITDVRAMILAARTAIDDAKQSLSGELGEDFDELRKPLGELGDLRRMNPKTALTRTLFDGDDTYLDLLTGKPAAGGGAGEVPAGDAAGAPESGAPAGASANHMPTAAIAADDATRNSADAVQPAGNDAKSTGAAGASAPKPAGGHNWADDDVL